jgi:hypothetical protein
MIPETFNMGHSFAGFKMDLLSQRTKIGAEIFCIVHGLTEVTQKWMEVERYLGNLLVEDFTELKEYAEMLFDDEKFTKSRKYFWAIRCLNEFDLSISDNIKQWDLYREARIDPVFADKDLTNSLDAAALLPPDEDCDHVSAELCELQRMVRQAQNLRDTLDELRFQFKSRLETAKALRDGVSLMFILMGIAWVKSQPQIELMLTSV